MIVTPNVHHDQHVAPPTVRGEVAIVGMACAFPGARNVAEYWRNIVGAVDCISEVPPGRWDPELFYDADPNAPGKLHCKRGGYLGDSFAFNPLRYGTMPRAVEGAEPDQFLVLRTVHEAIEDAGLLDADLSSTRAAFILGRGNYLGTGQVNLLQRSIMTRQTLDVLRRLRPDLSAEELRKISDELQGALPTFYSETAPGIIPNITTGRVANRLNLSGATFTLDAACASSLIATEIAVRDLLTGQADLALAGGVHIFTDVPFLTIFTALGALSSSGVIRPFDKDCDGTLPGEGVGIVVLKRLADATRDGDRIYAVIKGVGSSSDGRALSVTAPRVDGEMLALRRAYAMAGVSPKSVELVEAHGTGTPVGDPTELEALHTVFGPRDETSPGVALGSVKSMIGHAMPAAGVASLIKTALALYHGVLPASLNCRTPNDALRKSDQRFYLNSRTRPWVHGDAASPRRAGINAFGFGGVNAHVVLEEPPRSSAPASLIRDWDSELVLLRGDTAEALAGQATTLAAYLVTANAPLRDLAYSMNRLAKGRRTLALVVTSLDDLRAKLTRAAGRLQADSGAQIKNTSGVYYFADAPILGGKVAFLFPGLGAEYPHMMSELCMNFPEVRECFDRMDASIRAADGRPLSTDIFPPTTFEADELEKAAARLGKIERANPALMTGSGAMFILLEKLGIAADMMTGHSSGEWVSLPASGMADVDRFVSGMSGLNDVWSRLAADQSVPHRVMLAVGADRVRVDSVAREMDRPITIVNDNCAHQVVVVVRPDDAKPIREKLMSLGIFVEQLPYEHGYHTPEFQHVTEDLRRYFESLDLRKGKATVYSCSTASPYPKGTPEVVDLLANTFARPVRFRETIEAMYADGARMFVEVGPRGTLTAFVDDILRGRPHLAVATNQHRKSDTLSLHHALGRLAAAGVDMDLDFLYARRDAKQLTFDASKDQVVDPDTAPGVMRIPLHYKMMTVSAELAEELSIGLDRVGTQGRHEGTEARRHEETLGFQSRDLQGASPPFQSRDSHGAVERSHEATQPRSHEANVMRELTTSRDAGMPERQSADAVLTAHFQLMEQFLATQDEVMRAYLGGRGVQPVEPAARDAISGAAHPPTTPISEPRPSGSGSTVQIPPMKEVPVPVTAQELSRAETSAASTPTPSRDLTELLLSIVSERTGYPTDMLGLDADMEADLGIDSIKRVEILGTLQQRSGEGDSQVTVDMERVAKLKTLRQVVEFLSDAGTAAGVPSVNPPTLTIPGEIVRHTPSQEIVVIRRVDVNHDLYLEDHRFGPKLSDVDADAKALPVVPLTVSVETMAEVAALLAPGKVVVGAKDVQASKWIDLPRADAEVWIELTAKVVTPQAVRVIIKQSNCKPNGGGTTVAEGIIHFAERFPDSPALSTFELTDRRKPLHTAEELYAQRRMFHGPSFQGVASIDAVGRDGLLAGLRILPNDKVLASTTSPKFHIDPFLLDAAGQLVGYWPVEYLNDGFVLFPIRIRELSLFGPHPAAGVKLECRLRVREVSARQLRADMDILAPDDRLWMRVTGWEDWRFYFPVNFYDSWRFPNIGFVSDPLALAPALVDSDIQVRRVIPQGEMGTAIWENLWAHLICSRDELTQFHAMKEGPRRAEWIAGRAAAKDAVRAWVKSHRGIDLFPADIIISQDDSGRPSAGGHWVSQVGTAPCISISHKGSIAVAAASRRPIGIDLESIIARDESFERVAFDEDERRLLAEVNGRGHDEWLARAWTAKEAAGKALGAGLPDGPSSIKLKGIDENGDEVTFACRLGRSSAAATSDMKVQSVRDGDFVIGLAVRAETTMGDSARA